MKYVNWKAHKREKIRASYTQQKYDSEYIRYVVKKQIQINNTNKT